MNHILRISSKVCHPERGLASEANQTQSKDPFNRDSTRGGEGSFRVVVRFFDEHEAELSHISSREAAERESPARKCRVSERKGIESRRDVTRHHQITQ